MKILSVWLMFFFIVAPKFVLADWAGGHPGRHGEHRYYRYHDHPHFGLHVTGFYPEEYYPVWAGGVRYYYDDGIYYNYTGGNYVIVSPPTGVVVSSIPPDFQPVIINGTTYYTDNGIYYVKTPDGFKVITQPVASSAIPVAVGTQNVFKVNVPNNAGGYVTVTLRKSGNGYVGPQGEFYAEFPRVSQLKTMYGK